MIERLGRGPVSLKERKRIQHRKEVALRRNKETKKQISVIAIVKLASGKTDGLTDTTSKVIQMTGNP
jgi:hypothetical protein